VKTHIGLVKAASKDPHELREWYGWCRKCYQSDVKKMKYTRRHE
jgi:hypothetical protein